MGLYPLSQLMSELTNLVGVRTDLTPDRLMAALNNAQDRISQKKDFKEMQAVVQTATSYSGEPAVDKYLPYAPNWKTIHSVVCLFGQDSRKLVQIAWRKFDRLYPSPESVATYVPLYYADWNQQLVFMPVPDGVYPLNVRVTLLPTPFNATTPLTATSIFNGKDQIILDFAAAYLWRGFGRYDKAAYYENSAAGQLDIAAKADGDRPDLDTASGSDDNSVGAYWANPFIKGVQG